MPKQAEQEAAMFGIMSFRDQERWKEAEKLEVQIIKMRKRVLGAEHSNMLNNADQYKQSCSYLCEPGPSSRSLHYNKECGLPLHHHHRCRSSNCPVA